MTHIWGVESKVGHLGEVITDMGVDRKLPKTPWTVPASATADQNERLHLLVDAVTEYAIFLLAPDGTVMTWNPGAERLKGYAGVEIVGRHFSVFYPPEDVAAGKPAAELAEAVRAGTLTDDGWRVRKDGTRFWAHVLITPLYDGNALRGFAKVTRDDTAPRAAAGRGRALQEITLGLLLGTETSDVLTIISRHARQLTGAAMVWIAMPEGLTFVVRAADGPVTGPQIGTRLRGDAAMVAVMLDSRPVTVDDLTAIYPAVPEVSSCGAGLVVPLLAGDGVTGVLVAAAPAGASPFQAADLELLQVFAKQAELVLSYGRAQQALRGQQVADDRERIARDLHDHVIQQLFATGLGLQGSAMRMTQVEERSHIEDAVERLDQTIRQVRMTVFDLHERDPEATVGARANIAALVRDAGRALGFQPTLQFRGVIDSAAPASTWDQAFAALREMLSNVARHAVASAAEVFVAVTDDLLLKVTDNGIGPPAHLVPGSGLGNLQARASDLGGSFALEAATGQGAVASWRIPIS